MGLTKGEFGEFEFFEMGINFATSVTDDLRIGAQFFTRDLGPIGNSVISLDGRLPITRSLTNLTFVLVE